MKSAGPLRVLLVDDDVGVCELLAQFLQDEGFEPVCASGDRAAYDLLDAEWGSLSAVVVDINLAAATTGFDVARYARDLNPRLPVIYTTGAPPTAVERFGVANSTLVAKPFNLDLLSVALTAVKLNPPGRAKLA